MVSWWLCVGGEGSIQSVTVALTTNFDLVSIHMPADNGEVGRCTVPAPSVAATICRFSVPVLKHGRSFGIISCRVLNVSATGLSKEAPESPWFRCPQCKV